MDQQAVVGCVNCRHPSTAGVEEANLRVLTNLKTGTAEKGQPYARAGLRTGHTAKQFIVVLGTLVKAVAQVADVQADDGSPTAVEAGTSKGAAVRLVLVARAVVHTVATDVDWQAVTVVRTLEVGVRAQGVAVVRAVEDGGGEAASAVQQNESGRWQAEDGAGTEGGFWTLPLVQS